MRSWWVISCVIGLLIISTAGYGQDNPDKADDNKKSSIKDKEDDGSKLFVDLSGKMYLEYAHLHGFEYNGDSSWTKVNKWGYDFWNSLPVEATDYSKKKNDTFRMQRVYLTLRKRIGEIFSIKVTTDINPTGRDFIFLKYAFIQAYKDFGPVKLKGQIGKIGTPVIGITENLCDLRWVNSEAMTRAKYLLSGNGFDNTADFGFLYSMTVLDMVTLEYAFTNGEGYKYDDSETYDGKSHTILLSVNPTMFLKEAYINFYSRYEETNKNEIDTGDGSVVHIKYSGMASRFYWGFGVAWKSDIIKLGLNFFLPEKQYQRQIYPNFTPSYQKKFMLIDAWFHLNLGAVTPAGILLISRCNYGVEESSSIGNNRTTKKTLLTSAGIGYQFSKHFRMLVYYENIIYTADTYRFGDMTKRDPTTNRNVYVKAEAKY